MDFQAIRSSSVIASGSPMWGAWPGGGMHPLRLMGANLVDQKLNCIELKKKQKHVGIGIGSGGIILL